ncbi:MAG: type II toxin-antitoxin system RelE/ParE family toxin [Chloroflexi bacterium]|nr:type II toxin-antitoxin system RelE/ParE family toxin [Chloroflexota bacterium]
MYRISYTKQAARALMRMPKHTAKLVREKVENIAADPYGDHPNATKLQGREGYRLRVGDWRVIYQVQDKELLILVLKVASRGEVYR